MQPVRNLLIGAENKAHVSSAILAQMKHVFTMCVMHHPRTEESLIKIMIALQN